MRTLIIVGASNVTIALPILWNSIQQSPVPTRLIVVAGHGRSFGLPNTVLGRTLPSILQSDFWQLFRDLIDVQRTGNSPDEIRVILTDVGNDVLYGVPVNTIAEWVRETLQRLTVWTNHITLTELPLCSLKRLGRLRFQFFRRMFFPGSKLTFDAAQESGVALNGCVQELAASIGATLCVPQNEWYGVDPIHIRSRHRPAAWQSFLSTQDLDVVCRPASLSGASGSIATWRLPPHLRWRFGREERADQPIAHVNGNELWLF